ncbi:MAG: alpha/beta hydrolase [Rubrivivax sp.]|nr:alpha/beta hydrolase [Rubrivivax sp.]
MTTRDPDWLDRMYNNRALVAGSAEQLRGWSEASALARTLLDGSLGVPYGDALGETLDVYPSAQPDAPVLVFIHGGYWRALHSSDHAFVAPPFVRAGACVVVPNHALCPTVRVGDIVMQMVRALAWVHQHIAGYGGDPSRISVVGHSAGGHLAAMMLACRWPSLQRELPTDLVRNGMSISGLHELETIRRTPFLQVSLGLTPEEACAASPAWLVPDARSRGTGELYAVVGGQESPEFLRQHRLIRSAWGQRRVPVCEVLPGLNHFTILAALTQPGQRLHQLVCQLLGLPT